MRDINKIEKVFRELTHMVAALYEVEPVGGPLHIITDDGNLKDNHLISCYQDLDPDPRSTLVDTLCASILHLLSELTEPQRVIWWLHSSTMQVARKELAALAASVRDGIVEHSEHALYDCRILSPDGTKILWTNSQT